MQQRCESNRSWVRAKLTDGNSRILSLVATNHILFLDPRIIHLIKVLGGRMLIFHLPFCYIYTLIKHDTFFLY